MRRIAAAGPSLDVVARYSNRFCRVGAAVSEYKAYVVDAAGHVLKRHDFEAEDDAGAIVHARQYVDGHDIEVWQLGRVVGKLTHQ